MKLRHPGGIAPLLIRLRRAQKSLRIARDRIRLLEKTLASRSKELESGRRFMQRLYPVEGKPGHYELREPRTTA